MRAFACLPCSVPPSPQVPLHHLACLPFFFLNLNLNLILLPYCKFPPNSRAAVTSGLCCCFSVFPLPLACAVCRNFVKSLLNLCIWACPRRSGTRISQDSPGPASDSNFSGFCCRCHHPVSISRLARLNFPCERSTLCLIVFILFRLLFPGLDSAICTDLW